MSPVLCILLFFLSLVLAQAPTPTPTPLPPYVQQTFAFGWPGISTSNSTMTRCRILNISITPADQSHPPLGPFNLNLYSQFRAPLLVNAGTTFDYLWTVDLDIGGPYLMMYQDAYGGTGGVAPVFNVVADPLGSTCGSSGMVSAGLQFNVGAVRSQCGSVAMSVTGGTPPYTLTTIPELSEPKVVTFAGGSWNYTIDQKAGTNAYFSVQDALGVGAVSSFFTIAASSDSSCLGLAPTLTEGAQALSSTWAAGTARAAGSSSSGSHKVPIGAVVGGAVGGILILLVIMVLLAWWYRKRKASHSRDSTGNEMQEQNGGAIVRPTSGRSESDRRTKFSLDGGTPIPSPGPTSSSSPPPQMMMTGMTVTPYVPSPPPGMEGVTGWVRAPGTMSYLPPGAAPSSASPTDPYNRFSQASVTSDSAATQPQPNIVYSYPNQSSPQGEHSPQGYFPSQGPYQPMHVVDQYGQVQVVHPIPVHMVPHPIASGSHNSADHSSQVYFRPPSSSGSGGGRGMSASEEKRVLAAANANAAAADNNNGNNNGSSLNLIPPAQGQQFPGSGGGGGDNRPVNRPYQSISPGLPPYQAREG